MRNSFFFLTFVIIAFIGVISTSISSVIMSLFTLCIGFILSKTLSHNKEEQRKLNSVLFFSYIITTVFVLIHWLSISYDMSAFTNYDNDHYKFYIASQDGQNANSIAEIFINCIINNIYYENGGYYFIIQVIAYLATVIFDGNSVLLQQLGSAACCIWSSIFLCKILISFCPANQVNKYSFFYIAFSPLLLHSIGINRDPHIALLYMILIYISLCKKISIYSILAQLSIAFVLYFFRQQHGLFAVSFVGFSILISQSKLRWIYVISIIAIFGTFGLSLFYNYILESISVTNNYYEAYRDAALSGLDSGLGRYVYMLPSPIKELSQIVVLQMRFPPWGLIEQANNFYAFIVGIESLFVGIFWFYTFVSLISYIVKIKFFQLPKALSYGLIFLFFFLILNSSNLDSRRVICMYPFLFLPFVYLREYVISDKYRQVVNKKFILIYSSLCLVYFVFKILIG